MRCSRFELDALDIKAVAEAVFSECRMQRSYSNSTDDMIIIAAEDHKLRTSSTQMNMIIVKKNRYRVLYGYYCSCWRSRYL